MEDIDPFSLQGKLLVAAPDMADPSFKHSVIYLCEHDSVAAMGLVINKKKSGIFLSNILANESSDPVDILYDDRILQGGPVGTNQGFVLHTPFAKESPPRLNARSHRMADSLYFSTDKRTLQGLTLKCRPEHAIVTVGYAGWEAGQLEQEIIDNLWIVVDGDLDLIFDTDLDGKWGKALKTLGISAEQIATRSGKA